VENDDRSGSRFEYLRRRIADLQAALDQTDRADKSPTVSWLRARKRLLNDALDELESKDPDR